MKRRAVVYAGIIATWLAVGLGIASCGSSKSSSPKPQPTATTGTSSAVSAHSATVSGTVNASNQSGVTYYFEYGPTTNYGSLTTAQPVSGNSNQSVMTTLSNLSANTTYHYELVVKTSSGQLNKGGDQMFTTTPPTGGTVPRTTTGRTTARPTTGPYTTVRPTTGPYTTVRPTTGYTTTPPPSTGYTTTPPSTGYTTTPPSTTG